VIPKNSRTSEVSGDSENCSTLQNTKHSTKNSRKKDVLFPKNAENAVPFLSRLNYFNLFFHINVHSSLKEKHNEN